MKPQWLVQRQHKILSEGGSPPSELFKDVSQTATSAAACADACVRSTHFAWNGCQAFYSTESEANFFGETVSAGNLANSLTDYTKSATSESCGSTDRISSHEDSSVSACAFKCQETSSCKAFEASDSGSTSG
jgi:hypothetical protein